MTPDLPPPPPAAQVSQGEELTADQVKAKLKQTRAACFQHAAVVVDLRERAQAPAGPATKAHRKPT
jgi:hypothetical protein